MQTANSVSVEVRLKSKDILQAYFWSWQFIFRCCVTFFIALAAYDGCLAPDAIVKTLPDGPEISKVILAVVCLLILALTVFPYLRVRAAFRKTPAYEQTKRYTFSPEGMHFEKNDAVGDFKWTAFHKITETRSLFLIYQSPGSAIYLPKRCFGNSSDIEELRRLIIANFRGKWRLRRSDPLTATSGTSR